MENCRFRGGAMPGRTREVVHELVGAVEPALLACGDDETLGRPRCRGRKTGDLGDWRV